jgi:hypothetical protein
MYMKKQMWVITYFPNIEIWIYAVSPGHNPESLKFSHCNAEVIFIPTNTILILIPMDQGFIKILKSYYTCNIYRLGMW